MWIRKEKGSENTFESSAKMLMFLEKKLRL